MSAAEDLDLDPPEHYPCPATVEEVLQSAPRGFPRPTCQRLPQPWIAQDDDLGDVNAFRRAAAVMMKLCQVCGLELGVTTRLYWRPGDRVVIDGAGVHPDHCAALAERLCPHLRTLREQGKLREMTVLTSTLRIVSVDIAEMPKAYATPVAS